MFVQSREGGCVFKNWANELTRVTKHACWEEARQMNL